MLSDKSDDVSPFEPPVYGMLTNSPVSSPSVYGRGMGLRQMPIEIPDFDPPVYGVGDDSDEAPEEKAVPGIVEYKTDLQEQEAKLIISEFMRDEEEDAAREEKVSTNADQFWKFNEKTEDLPEDDFDDDEDDDLPAPSNSIVPATSTGALLSGNYLNSMVSNWVKKLNLNETITSPSIEHHIGVLKMNEPTVCHKILSYKTSIEEKANQYKNMAGLKALNPTQKYLQAPDFFSIKPNVGFEYQAKKFPRLKEVSTLWKFDFSHEEKKRFSAGSRQAPELMWDPRVLSNEQVQSYLNEVYRIFKKKSGMSEEIALKYLVAKQYNVIEAIYGM